MENVIPRLDLDQIAGINLLRGILSPVRKREEEGLSPRSPAGSDQRSLIPACCIIQWAATSQVLTGSHASRR